MADRPDGYGLTAEVKAKISGKYDSHLASVAMLWIEDFVPGSGVGDLVNSEDIHQKLKDGVVLCNLMNSIRPGTIKKINNSKLAFKQMENIGQFLEAIQAYGVKETDSFQTVDLYDGINIGSVINTLHALGRRVQQDGLQGIGPKQAEPNKRHFTIEQLRAGEGLIGLQMGSNKGANQAGMNFGKTRAIID